MAEALREDRRDALLRSRGRRLFSDRLLATLASWVERAFASDEIARRPGLLQRLDPRVKLLAMTALIVVAALSSDLVVLAVLLAGGVGLVVASRIGLRLFAGRAWVFIPLFTAAIVAPALLNIVTPGRAVLTFWQHGAPFWPLPDTLAITQHGIVVAVRLVLRVTATVTFAVLLTMTTPWADLLKALRVVFVPRTFVFVLAMAYRYVFTLVRVVQDMAIARTSRTVGRASGRDDRRFAGAAVATLFGKSQATSEQAYLAMVSRGYTGEVRTLSVWRLRWLDYVCAAAAAAAVTTLVWLELVHPWS